MADILGEGDKLLVCDVDDTLWGTARPVWQLHKHIARIHYGIDLDDGTILQHWGEPVAQLARHLYRTDNIELALERIVQAGTEFPKEPFDFTIPTLRRFKAAGITIAAVSATTRRILADDAVRTGIPLDLFSFMQTGEDTEHHKPDPRVFDPLLQWAEKQGIQKSEIVYIGDSLGDWRAARDAGIRFVGVETGLINAAQFRAERVMSVPNLSYL